MTAAALPPGGRPADAGRDEAPGEVPNRLGAFFAAVSNGHRDPEPVTADPTT